MVDSSGNIYVADTHNHKIRKIVPAALTATDFTLSVAGGTATFSTGPPTGISAAGNVYTLTLPTIYGIPTGEEMVTVNPASGTAIYNINGEAAAALQSSNNTVTMQGALLNRQVTLSGPSSNSV